MTKSVLIHIDTDTTTADIVDAVKDALLALKAPLRFVKELRNENEEGPLWPGRIHVRARTGEETRPKRKRMSVKTTVMIISEKATKEKPPPEAPAAITPVRAPRAQKQNAAPGIAPG